MRGAEPVTVLVTGVGSNIGQGIMKSLRMSGLPVRIIGTDCDPLSAGLFRCDKGVVLPRADSDDYMERIARLCREEGVAAALPGSDAEPPVLAANKEALEAGGAVRVIVSPEPVVKVFHDKWETNRFFAGRGISVPETVLADAGGVPERFPVVVKPRRGSGSRGLSVVRDGDELGYALARVKDAVVQEFLDGEEYTAGAFFDRNSALRGIIIMKREILFGTSYRAVVDTFPEVRAQVERIALEIGKAGATGPINIQGILTGGVFRPIEVNPRFSGTTVFRARFGFNEPEAAVRHFALGEDVPALVPGRGAVFRYWQELYTSIEEVETVSRDGCISGSRSETPGFF